MKKNYVKEINNNIDGEKKIECVNLSIGASNKQELAWIINNLQLFKEESLRSYNEVISSIMHQEKMKLYFVVYEKSDTEFTAVKKHLGVWHGFQSIFSEERSKDFYLDEKLRCAYVKLDGLKIEQISVPHCGYLILIKDESEVIKCFEKYEKDKDIFDILYGNGFVIAKFRDLWTDGNALVFYSKEKEFLTKITHIALENNFLLIN